MISGATNGMKACAAVWNGSGRRRAPRRAGAERGDQGVGADHVDDAAIMTAPITAIGHCAAVAGLLGQRRRCFEPAEREDRQAEREQHVLRPPGRGRRRGQAAGPAPTRMVRLSEQQHDLEHVQRDGHPDAEPEAHDHRRTRLAVDDRDDLGLPQCAGCRARSGRCSRRRRCRCRRTRYVPEDRDHADGHGDLRADRLGDVGHERPGAWVDAGELGQARWPWRPSPPWRSGRSAARTRRQADDHAGREEQVERRARPERRRA